MGDLFLYIVVSASCEVAGLVSASRD